jgi:hypothetical protein
MPFETPHDSGGTILNWNAGTAGTGTIYTVTNIVISFADPTADAEKIDVAHLAQTAGEQAKTLDLPLVASASGDTGRTVQFDYVGKTLISDKETGTLTITVGGSSLVGKAGTVQSSTLTLATNNAIRGQATIRISRT